MEDQPATAVPVNGHGGLKHEPSSLASDEHNIDIDNGHSSKRNATEAGVDAREDDRDKRRKGAAPVKEEYLIKHEPGEPVEPKSGRDEANDDAAEAFHHRDRQPQSSNTKNKRQKNKGQNKAREFGSSRDEVGLCSTRTSKPEFSPDECSYGDKCRFEHDLRRYLNVHKRADLLTFGGLCPVWEVKGRCNMGWKCRFVKSHSEEVACPDGRKELVLTEDAEKIARFPTIASEEDSQPGVVNVIGPKERMDLTKRKYPTPKSDIYLPWLDAIAQNPGDQGKPKKHDSRTNSHKKDADANLSPETEGVESKQDTRSHFYDPPLRPSEKRRLYFGPDTPVLAPLTTQGNLPFRRLCTSLGASFTYSEMAMSLPIIQGQKSEWALIKGHESEILPPTFTTQAQPQTQNIVYDYNHSADMRLGAQISASKPWTAIKATEVLTSLLPNGLRLIDLNCGCPIDLVYREGAGSALMDSPNKLEKILRGMNAVSGSTPVTVKIRTGTKDKHPTAQKLVDRLILGANPDTGGGGDPSSTRNPPCGVAAITLHGRSRQQRYTKSADWEYITSTASLVQNLNERADRLSDTIHEADDRDQPNAPASRRIKTFFLGNGDVYSPEHYTDHITHASVDAVMLARGALIKPWLFEEIATNQTLDKSSSQRLSYIESFCRFGLEAWGSDEIGVGQTRRFLLEWLSFACRYIPVGLLEVLPPNLNDRPPRYKGRDELETLMASDNYLDWIKISEMFLGPAHKDFKFEPKHKSNSYEAEG